MRNYHVIKRGNKYHYVCRVPSDLRHFFPVTTIYRSLRSSDLKVARLLATTQEHTTQGVFMRLRSVHLDENAIRQMLTRYLGGKLEILEAKVLRKTYSNDDDLSSSDSHRPQIINQFDPLGERIDRVSVGAGLLGIKAADRVTKLRAGLISGDFHNEDKARELAKRFGVKLHRDDQESLQLRLMQLDNAAINSTAITIFLIVSPEHSAWLFVNYHDTCANKCHNSALYPQPTLIFR
jgi:hypothetical protein